MVQVNQNRKCIRANCSFRISYNLFLPFSYFLFILLPSSLIISFLLSKEHVLINLRIYFVHQSVDSQDFYPPLALIKRSIAYTCSYFHLYFWKLLWSNNRKTLHLSITHMIVNSITINQLHTSQSLVTLRIAKERSPDKQMLLMLGSACNEFISGELLMSRIWVELELFA